MLVVGLTGGIGSGKTEAANIFKSLGVPVIDTDVIAHQLTEKNSPVLKKIIDQFGDGFLLSNKQLNRKLLSSTIFDNAEKRKKLENILHPAIKKSVEHKIANLSTSPYIIVVIPLLFETSFKHLVDRVLVIDSNENEQISRTRKRDRKTQSQIEKIMQQQISRQQRLMYADDIIDNSGTLSALQIAVNTLHIKYLSTEINK